MSKVHDRNAVVLDRIKEMSADDEHAARVFNEELDIMLNSLSMEDFFGTEGQTDPRGDQREDPWTMEHVQGIDPWHDE